MLFRSIDESVTRFEMPNLINEDLAESLKILGENNSSDVVLIGDGNRVIQTYPSRGTSINSKDKIMLVTNSRNIEVPNFYNWSSRNVRTYCRMVQIDCQIEGYGYVYNQSVETGTQVTDETELIVNLRTRIE